MRLNWSYEEDRPGQFALFNANRQRSLQGKAGQRALREFEAALLALPEKRLIHGRLVDDEGGVCAVACYAKHKGVNLDHFDPEDESDEVGVAGGMPRLVAWSVVAQNDIHLESKWEPPTKHHPHGRSVDITPEERYEKVLAWVRAQLK
jgi:hypothetical protein